MITERHCRTQINKNVSRVRRAFKWATSRGLCPVSVLQNINTVEGLRAGRSAARESEPIKPVEVHLVEATLPELAPPAAAMVQVQLLTGMRPGEIVAMRTIDLDTSGKVWSYRPGSDQGPHGRHKTAHRGRDRTILIGPRAQEILRPWLRLALEECIFQPREALTWHNEQRRKARKTPLYPSQKNRKAKRGAKWTARDHYDVSSYANSIARACGALDPRTGQLLWVEGQRKNSALFIALLNHLLTTYRRAPLIHVVLDNFRIHDSKLVHTALAGYAGHVRLHFLPPYSPDENKIERVWEDLHANVTRNHSCSHMDDLMNEVRRYLRDRNRAKACSTRVPTPRRKAA
jgi:transposase